MSELQVIAENFRTIEERINFAVQKSGRQREDVQLLAVSKKQAVTKMIALQKVSLQHNRQTVFGENYVQEFREKKGQLTGSFSTHFIGTLQRNKARDAVQLFDVIESVDSVKLVEAVNKEAKKSGCKQNIFLQVNISNDPSKGGFSKPDVINFMMTEASTYENVLVSGLMTITEYYANPHDVKGDFRAMRELRDEVKEARSLPNALLLSMGMSRDYEIAIEEGANIIRIGTALFGERKVS